jgi:NAD(P)-dependent dehydrogenase (short-subunit alcohol dehydrogenase family)
MTRSQPSLTSTSAVARPLPWAAPVRIPLGIPLPYVIELAEERVAIVTGAASGIGAAVVERLHHDGLRVAGWDLSLVPSLDVSDPAAVAAATARVAAEMGPPTVLVNCAGRRTEAAMGEITHEQWRADLATNLDGSFNCMNAVLPHMLAAGGGVIVNFASTAGRSGFPNRVAYTASKFGVVGLTMAAARDLGPRGIRVVCVAPGPTATPLTAHMWQGVEDDPVARTVPLGRWAQPAEIASVVAFLVSPDASYVNGTVVTADGGQLAH